MTKPEWIEILRDNKNWVFVFETSEVSAMFPEWPLNHYLQAFCAMHGLSYRIIKARYLFTRALPQQIVEAIAGELESGESLDLETAVR